MPRQPLIFIQFELLYLKWKHWNRCIFTRVTRVTFTVAAFEQLANTLQFFPSLPNPPKGSSMINTPTQPNSSWFHAQISSAVPDWHKQISRAFEQSIIIHLYESTLIYLINRLCKCTRLAFLFSALQPGFQLTVLRVFKRNEQQGQIFVLALRLTNLWSVHAPVL